MLSLIGHPVVLGHGTSDPHWTVAAVDRVFREDKVGPLQAVGLHRR